MSLSYVSIKSSHYKTTSLNSISFQYPRSHISTFTITGIMQTENRVTISRVVRVRGETGTAGQTRAAQAKHSTPLAPFLTILAESKNSDKTDNWRLGQAGPGRSGS